MIWLIGYGAFAIVACLLTVAGHDIGNWLVRRHVRAWVYWVEVPR